MEQLPLNIKSAVFEAAFAEAMAFAKYIIYSAACKDIGYHSVSMLFDQLARNEKEHLEQHMKNLGILYPDDIESMLRTSIQAEVNEANGMYPALHTLCGDAPESSKIIGDVQDLVLRLSYIEKHHSELMARALDTMTNPEGTDAPEPKQIWVCSHCGNIYESFDDIPDECPVCKHSKADYILAY